jgi:copper chaperone
MSCEHCVKAVTGAIRAQDPAAEVAVDLGAGVVRAETRLDATTVAAAITEEGYKVLGAA